MMHTHITSSTKQKRNSFWLSIYPILYHLLKIYKSLTNPQGCPIISGIHSATINLSHYLDFFLQKYVMALLNLKDLREFIQELNTFYWEQDDNLLTLDMAALYSNICHSLSLQYVNYYRTKDVPHKKDFLLVLSSSLIITTLNSR